jgi:hypothetical protein
LGPRKGERSEDVRAEIYVNRRQFIRAARLNEPIGRDWWEGLAIVVAAYCAFWLLVYAVWLLVGA